MFLITKYFEGTLSSRVLSVRNHVFPSKSPLGTYFRMLNLLIKSYSRKRVLTSLDYKRKRLIMGNLLNLVYTIRDVNLLDDDAKLGYFFLQTVFIHLLTPRSWVPIDLRPIPKLKDYRNLIVPKNDSGSSCFCDAVLVAMFLTSHENDKLLPRIPFSGGDFYPWEEAEGETELFLSLFDEKIPKVILMSTLKSSCRNVNEANELIDLLMTIVTQMRDVPNTKKDRDEKTELVGQIITVFRGELFDKCDIGTPFQQESAPLFLVNMVRLNHMNPVLFPLIREIRVDSFYSGNRRVEAVPDLVNFGIPDPVLTTLNPGEGKKPRTLQEVINSEYFPNIEIELLKDPESFKKGGIFANHINKFTRVENIKNLAVERKLVRSFIKLPKVLVLEMSRALPTQFGPRKIQFDITIPDSMQLTIPMFEPTNSNPINITYRIIAIVCHTSGLLGIESGHYITYFLPYEEKNNWLLYNDVAEQMLVNADITKSPHANTIKRDAVLYFLIKE